jgi:hypothetical protein
MRLDISLRARLNGANTAITLSLLPEHTFDSLEAAWVALVRARNRAPTSRRSSLDDAGRDREALLRRAGVAEGTTLAGAHPRCAPRARAHNRRLAAASRRISAATTTRR